MGGQRGRRETQRFPEFADREPVGPCLHERAESSEPALVSQGSEGGECLFGVHSSIILELWNIASGRYEPRRLPSRADDGRITADVASPEPSRGYAPLDVHSKGGDP